MSGSSAAAVHPNWAWFPVLELFETASIAGLDYSIINTSLCDMCKSSADSCVWGVKRWIRILYGLNEASVLTLPDPFSRCTVFQLVYRSSFWCLGSVFLNMVPMLFFVCFQRDDCVTWLATLTLQQYACEWTLSDWGRSWVGLVAVWTMRNTTVTVMPKQCALTVSKILGINYVRSSALVSVWWQFSRLQLCTFVVR